MSNDQDMSQKSDDRDGNIIVRSMGYSSYQNLHPDTTSHLKRTKFTLPCPTRYIYNMVLLLNNKKSGPLHVAPPAGGRCGVVYDCSCPSTPPTTTIAIAAEAEEECNAQISTKYDSGRDGSDEKTISVDHFRSLEMPTMMAFRRRKIFISVANKIILAETSSWVDLSLE